MIAGRRTILGTLPAAPVGTAATTTALSAVRAAAAGDHDDAAADLLVDELRRGTIGAVVTAFDRHHHRVRALARRLLWDDAAAEDVVQEVFASLPRCIRNFRGDSTLETFLLAIVVRRVRHHRRAAMRRRRALERLERLDCEGHSPAPDPEHRAYSRQLAVRLAGALDELPLILRVAFVLCEIEGLTAGEAAGIAAVPEATIRTRLFHARRKLRDRLSREYSE